MTATDTMEPENDTCAGAEFWARLQREMAGLVKPEHYETWLRKLSLVRLDQEELELLAPSAFNADWVRDRYCTVIERAAASVAGRSLRIRLTVDRYPDEEVEFLPPAAAAPAQPRNGSVTKGLPLNPSYTFENFVVGSSNRFAQAAAHAVTDNPGGAYNPLFLHGSVGMGKTHLLQAICHALQAKKKKFNIVYLPCETFRNEYVDSFKNRTLDAFQQKYRSVDVLLIDDIHFLAKWEGTQSEFFHTFNLLYNSQRQIVLSSDAQPAEIPLLKENLVSRFKWGLVVEIEPPDMETRMAILKQKARQRGHELPDDVAAFLAEHISSNIRELEGAVAKVIIFSAQSGRRIDLALVKQAMRGLLQAKAPLVTCQQILEDVSEATGVPIKGILGPSRQRAVTEARQLGMYLASELTNHSLQEVAPYFGRRDHTTVINAGKRTRLRMVASTDFRDLVGQLVRKLRRIR